MILDEIKAQMKAAMKAGHKVEKEILRVALGEISTAAARTDDGTLGDPEVQKILRKLVKSNQETRRNTTDEAERAVLDEETGVLERFLPRVLSAEQIALALAPVAEAIRGAQSDGQATGVAMKHLKGEGATVDGRDVAAAVGALRAESGDAN
ncbi:MAG: GatB/YqeY domain-containing protein [Myxococcota bacterium]